MHPLLRAVLEYGPIIGFVIAYLIFREDMFRVGGTEYTGFVAVTAAFIPLFLFGIGALWALTGQIARLQIATAVMLVVFGGLSVWFNDPRFFKMKPTAIYLLLALLLAAGLLRGQFWLQYIFDDMIHLKDQGWRVLTRRMLGLFLVSAAANELVWRTQSETVWVTFETIVMPILVIAFFLTQLGVFVDHATLAPAKKKRGKARR